MILSLLMAGVRSTGPCEQHDLRTGQSSLPTRQTSPGAAQSWSMVRGPSLVFRGQGTMAPRGQECGDGGQQLL